MGSLQSSLHQPFAVSILVGREEATRHRCSRPSDFFLATADRERCVLEGDDVPIKRKNTGEIHQLATLVEPQAHT